VGIPLGTKEPRKCRPRSMCLAPCVCVHVTRRGLLALLVRRRPVFLFFSLHFPRRREDEGPRAVATDAVPRRLVLPLPPTLAIFSPRSNYAFQLSATSNFEACLFYTGRWNLACEILLLPRYEFFLTSEVSHGSLACIRVLLSTNENNERCSNLD
jgi:hypothetical protein